MSPSIFLPASILMPPSVSKETSDRGPPWAAPIAAAALLLCSACSDAALTPYQAKPMAFHPLAAAQVTSSGADNPAFSLPLSVATASGRVAIGAEVGCTSELSITASAADGSCALKLSFGQRTDGPGLALTTATLTGRDKSGTCAALAPQLPSGGGDVIYTLTGGHAWLPWVEPASADAADGKIAIDKVLVDLKGEAILSAGASTLTLGDHSLQLGGDLTLDADTGAACTPCAAAACKSPYPQYRLRDAQPKSVAYNLAYTLDRWLGQHLVVILTQGW